MDKLLQENSDRILQEDSFFILLETQAGGGPSFFQEYAGVFSVIPKQYRGYRY